MTRRVIDLSRDPRRTHLEYFNSMPNPYVGVTVNVDVTALYELSRRKGCSFFLTCLYAAVNAANRVPELRRRIVDGQVVEYDVCPSSHTVSLPDGTYTYCTVDCSGPFDDFLPRAEAAVRAAEQHSGIDTDADEAELYFVSCLPWLRFTSLVQPTPTPADSNPRLTFGQMYEENGRRWMPLAVLVNHALMDGRHIGRYYENFARVCAELAGKTQAPA